MTSGTDGPEVIRSRTIAPRVLSRGQERRAAGGGGGPHNGAMIGLTAIDGVG